MRDKNGRYISTKDDASPDESHKTIELPEFVGDHPSNADLRSVFETRQAYSFEKVFENWWLATDKLFEAADESQRNSYRVRRAEHAARLCELIRKGGSDATLIAEMANFHRQAMTMPRTPPPAPTPRSERERVERDLCNGQFFKVPYVGPEMDALEFILSKEPSATRIERFDIKSITLSSGRVVQRRELREYYPVGTTRLENGWYRQFPSPATYEVEHEPGRVPFDQRVTVVRE
jgi:hypothetical protein